MTTYKRLIDRDKLWFYIRFNFDDNIASAVSEALKHCKTYQLKSIDAKADVEEGLESIEEGFD